MKTIARLTVALVLTVIVPKTTLADDNNNFGYSFGIEGITTTDLGGWDTANAITLQPNGKIIITGTTITNNDRSIATVRYNPNGTLDTTFGTQGTITTDLGGWDTANAITLQPNGKIIITGTTITNNDRSIATVRYNPNGTLDTTFGTQGTITTDLGGWDTANAITLQPNGKIIITGTTITNNDRSIATVRYNPNGTLDTTFGTQGTITTDLGGWDTANAITLQPNGKIIITGTTITNNDRSIATVRYNPNGTLDTTFGTQGTITTDLGGWDTANAITLQPNGKIIITGTTITNNDRSIATVRYNPNGTLDTTFGTQGTITTDLGGWDTANAITLQPNGKIIITGTTITNNDRSIATVRYNPNGTLDTTFGTQGTITTDLGGWDTANAITLQPNGKIIITGTTNTNLFVARYGIWKGVFRDDDDNIHEAAIEELVANRIVTGCNINLYCPNEPVTRAQIAVFISQAIGSIPDKPSTSRFSDIPPDATYLSYVEHLADRGIIKGCQDDVDNAPALYCPDDPITRAQMAILLVRAFNLTEAPANSAGFVDIEHHHAAPAIATIHAAGITLGCDDSPARYCPDDPITRAQMASYIRKALALPNEPVTRAQIAVFISQAIGSIPDKPSTSRFSDIPPDATYLSYVEHLADRGIIKGCQDDVDNAPALYCPDDPITRAQMAILLVRAFNLTEAPANSAGFVDIEHHHAAPAIATIYAAGITLGCDDSPARYCPDDPITWAQMASYIRRALALLIYV